jgi:heme/copper-type cytochrome/quinol oxidase subunit 1
MMDKWEPIFWIIGLCVAFFAVLMVLDYLKMKRRKPDHKVG